MCCDYIKKTVTINHLNLTTLTILTILTILTTVKIGEIFMPLFWRTLVTSGVVSLISCASLASTPNVGFAPSEHLTAGDQVNIHFSSSDLGQAAYVFHLANGLALSYGDILFLGDDYGVVGKPISLGTSDQDRQLRFIAAFNTLTQQASANPEAKKIVDVVRNEQKVVLDRLQKGEEPEKIYDEIASDTSRQINCITGGGCDSATWWLKPGRYLQLTTEDYDHFGSNAWLAYTAGHQAAINEAIAAHQTNDLKRLETAYAMNAFACHFLSDRFAAGHIRSPRVELPAKVTPTIVGHALVNYMHNEENAAGIHVHNSRGDNWMTYGDHSYFNHKNDENRKQLNEALQVSAHEIFIAYLQGSNPNNNAMREFIPNPDEVGAAADKDISSLFYWDSKSQQLMRRNDMSNLYDKHWTSNWWGWSTLTELARLKGVPPHIQRQLALSNDAEKAVEDGLITDKDIVSYVKSVRH
jgi:hypothetical protein